MFDQLLQEQLHTQQKSYNKEMQPKWTNPLESKLYQNNNNKPLVDEDELMIIEDSSIKRNDQPQPDNLLKGNKDHNNGSIKIDIDKDESLPFSDNEDATQGDDKVEKTSDREYKEQEVSDLNDCIIRRPENETRSSIYI